MAISFEVRVGHLVTEFLADALVLFRALQTAWTVAAFGLEAFADHRHDFLVFVETDSHYFSTPKQACPDFLELGRIASPKLVQRHSVLC